MYNCENCNNKTDSIIEVNAKNYPKRLKLEKDDKICVCQQCKNCFEENERSLKEILSSGYKNKLVLGGPGTGKTFLFKNLIENLPENSSILVITFINNLVGNLEKQLSNILNRKIDVRTLHSFCKNFLLSKVHPYEYFPELPKVIEDDSFLLGLDFKERKFDQAFVGLEKEDNGLKFYFSRSAYYNAVSHDDAVYRVFSYLSENNTAIPQYTQVIVDEYQDFNLLESSLIGLLGQKNKIIIAGDDDQALYRFKSASPNFIRKLYQDKNFKKGFLPFCRRCTSVLVEAANKFISNAKTKGLLNNRIEKEFKCYWPDKFLDSGKYQNIFIGKCSADSIVSKYINEKILSIIKDENTQPSEKDEPEFLIVGPPRISHYLHEVNESLLKDKRIDKDIFEIEFKKEPHKLSINEGYEFIKKDSNSNLGWRIVMYKDRIDSSLKKDREIIRESLDDKSIKDLLPEAYINRHKEKIESVSFQETENSEDFLGKKIKIKLTTYLGAKGLSANHVFVLGLENGIFPKDPINISDDETCQFIVLLTRARRSLRILSVDKRFDKKLKQRTDNLSVFVSMVPKEFFKISDINASNFNKV